MVATPPTTGATGTEYTLEHAEDHIAQLRGQTDILGELHAFADSQAPDVAPGVGNGSQLYSVGGTAQIMSAAGLAGALPASVGDPTQFTVTQATDNPLSSTFTIPANDPQVGTTYELDVWGSCTWGSTQQALVLSLYLGGVNQASEAIGATQFNASAGIRWKVRLIAQCATTGAAGTWSFSMEGAVSLASGNLLAGTGANGTIGIAGGTGTNVTQDTTVSNAFLLQAHWAATTGAPTLTTRGALFKRSGA